MSQHRTPDQWAEHLKIKRHGQQMKAAREMYGTHIICPDCYAPPSRCQHDRPYDRRQKT